MLCCKAMNSEIACDCDRAMVGQARWRQLAAALKIVIGSLVSVKHHCRLIANKICLEM